MDQVLVSIRWVRNPLGVLLPLQNWQHDFFPTSVIPQFNWVQWFQAAKKENRASKFPFTTKTTQPDPCLFQIPNVGHLSEKILHWYRIKKKKLPQARLYSLCLPSPSIDSILARPTNFQERDLFHRSVSEQKNSNRICSNYCSPSLGEFPNRVFLRSKNHC